MFKKVMKCLAVALIAVAAVSCSDQQKKDCNALKAAIVSGNIEEATSISDKLYNDLPGCTVETLGTLTQTYLALFGSQPVSKNTLEYLKRAAECYDMAKEKDPAKTKEIFNDIAKQAAPGTNIDFDQLFELFRQQLDSPEMQAVFNQDQEETKLRDIDMTETEAVAED